MNTYMNKTKLLLLALVGCVAVFAVGQTAPRAVPPGMLPKVYVRSLNRTPTEIRTFYISGKEHRSVLRASQAEPPSEWNSSSPLPMGFAKAEEVARGELAMFVNDAAELLVSDFHVGRFAGQPYWYMAVTFEPATQVVSDALPPDSFTVLLDFAGRVGRISRVEAPK